MEPLGDSEVMKVGFSWVGLVLVQGPRELSHTINRVMLHTVRVKDWWLSVVQESSSVVICCLCSDQQSLPGDQRVELATG